MVFSKGDPYYSGRFGEGAIVKLLGRLFDGSVFWTSAIRLWEVRNAIVSLWFSVKAIVIILVGLEEVRSCWLLGRSRL
ncbi:MAG: hypothetical protein AB4368_02965 [Xenococcaceae cyanobacterium]